MAQLLVCTATEMEGRLLTASGIPVLVTGVGPVSAALALARRLAGESVDRVVVCGVGGAYPDSGIAVGDVVCAETEIYGDLGAETTGGFVPLDELGIPGVGPDDIAFSLDLFPTGRRAGFVTCSTCTGTDARARSLRARTDGDVESMEGAALVQVAKAFGVPIGEVRGISNPVGDRDRDSWRLEEAAEAAQKELLRWLAS